MACWQLTSLSVCARACPRAIFLFARIYPQGLEQGRMEHDRSRHALTNERFWSLSLSSDGRPLYEPVSTPCAVIQSLDVAPFLPRARHAPRAREVSQSLVPSIQSAKSRADSAPAGFHIKKPSVCCLYLRLSSSDCLCRSIRCRRSCVHAVFALDLATQRFASTLKHQWPSPETLSISLVYLVP